MQIKAARHTTDSFFSAIVFIKTRIKRIEVLSIKRVGDEPQGSAEIINLSKCS